MSPAAEILSWICRRSAASSDAAHEPVCNAPQSAAALDSSATNAHQKIEARFTLGGKKIISEKIIF
jgi:hypothetical protein